MLKICKDCAHSRQRQFQLVCAGVETIDLVYGSLKLCATERQTGTQCGTVGWIFTPKKEQND